MLIGHNSSFWWAEGGFPRYFMAFFYHHTEHLAIVIIYLTIITITIIAQMNPHNININEVPIGAYVYFKAIECDEEALQFKQRHSNLHGVFESQKRNSLRRDVSINSAIS